MRPCLRPDILHHPRSSTAQVLRPRLRGPRHPRPFHPPQRSSQRHRSFLVEGLLAGLATALMTGVALASPAMLRQDPLISLGDLAGRVVPGLGQPSAATLDECP